MVKKKAMAFDIALYFRFNFERRTGGALSSKIGDASLKPPSLGVNSNKIIGFRESSRDLNITITSKAIVNLAAQACTRTKVFVIVTHRNDLIRW